VAKFSSLALWVKTPCSPICSSKEKSVFNPTCKHWGELRASFAPLRFSTIFGETVGVFLKNQCYDQRFALFSFVFESGTPIFVAIFFGENVLKIVTSVPGLSFIFSPLVSSEPQDVPRF
jgi:hypothetical protein